MLRITCALAVTVVVTCGIVLAAPPIRTEGSVLMEDGSPVAGASVTVLAVASDKAVAKKKSKKDGKFSITFFPVAPEGVYKFLVEKDGLLMKSISVKMIQEQEVAAEFRREIGPFQELHEFVVRTGGQTVVDVTMVPAEQFAKFLVIPGDQASTEKLTRANKLSGEGRFEESDTLLQELLASGVENANILFLLGRNAFADRRDGTAWFEKALALNPEMPGIHGQLGVAAFERGEHETALEFFEKEMAIGPSPGLRINRAVALKELGRTADAIVALEEIVDSTPGQTSAYAELAALYLDQGEGAKASETLERMEASSPADPTLWFNIGANFSNRSQFDQAEMAYRRALAIDPEFANAVRELGFLQIRMGNPKGALEYLDKYLVAQPDAADAAQVRGIRDTLAASAGE